MGKLAIALLILVHVHHSIVMMVGELLQVKVVAAAKAAGIPFFEHQGEQDRNAGHQNDEALEIEEIDYCSRNFLFLDAGQQAPTGHPEYSHRPQRLMPLVYYDIITPPPQNS